MQDIVERLRAGSWANAPWEPEYKVPPTSLHLEAAEEIERLKADLEAAIKEVAKWAREAGKWAREAEVSQFREAQLREKILLIAAELK